MLSIQYLKRITLHKVFITFIMHYKINLKSKKRLEDNKKQMMKNKKSTKDKRLGGKKMKEGKIENQNKEEEKEITNREGMMMKIDKIDEMIEEGMIKKMFKITGEKEKTKNSNKNKNLTKDRNKEEILMMEIEEEKQNRIIEEKLIKMIEENKILNKIKEIDQIEWTIRKNTQIINRIEISKENK